METGRELRYKGEGRKGGRPGVGVRLGGCLNDNTEILMRKNFKWNYLNYKNMFMYVVDMVVYTYSTALLLRVYRNTMVKI